MIKAKIISSLEKCFIRDDIDKFEQIKSITVLKNERFSFQVVVSADDTEISRCVFADLDIGGKLKNTQPCASWNAFRRCIRVIPTKRTTTI